MAETILKIVLEGAQKAEDGIDGVSKSFSEVGAASKKAGQDTAKVFKDTKTEADKLNETLKNGIPKIDFKKPAQSIQELKSQIRQFTSEAIKAGEGTKAFSAAMAEAGKRKGELKDLQQAVAALDPDTKGKAFLQLSQTIITGFAAGTGALQAFGLSTEDAQKTLVKLQAALAFGQFLGQVGELGDTFSILKTQINNSAIAQKAFNLVMSANPFILTITAVAALGGALVLLSGDAEDNAKEFIENSEAVKQSSEARKKLVSDIEDLQIALNEELGILDKNSADKLKSFNKYSQDFDEANKRFNDAKIEIDKKFGAKGFFELRTRIQIENELKEANRLLDLERQKEFAALNAKFKLQEKLLDAKTFNEAAAEADKQSKEESDKEKKKNEDKLKRIKEQAEKNAKTVKDGLDFIKKVNEKDVEDGIKGQEELNKKKEELEITGTQKTLANIELLTQAKKDELEIALANEIKHNQDLTDLEKKKRDVKIQFAQATTDSLNAIASVASLAGAQSVEFQKALALAQIAINTAQSISAGIAGATTSATATGPGAFVATPIFIATTIATILGAFASAAAVLNSATVPQPKFAEGGYTGDGGKYDIAGTVHKGEFVTTKEGTAKHRGLLEAIHNDKAPSIADINTLLKGTGVVLLPESALNISNQLSASQNQKLYQQQASDKNIEELNKNFKKFLAQQGKNVDKTLLDGTRIVKSGNTTRIIRKRRI